MYKIGQLLFIRQVDGKIGHGIVTSESDGPRHAMMNRAIYNDDGSHAGNMAIPIRSADIVTQERVAELRSGFDIIMRAYSWFADQEVV